MVQRVRLARAGLSVSDSQHNKYLVPQFILELIKRESQTLALLTGTVTASMSLDMKILEPRKEGCFETSGQIYLQCKFWFNQRLNLKAVTKNV